MQPQDLFHLDKLAVVVCRPALPRDTPQVMELTRHIWDGEDYVPSVWSDWMADPEGMLAVAEYGGRVIGLSKLSRLSPSEWWLQGLRVHPEFQGRGVASRLHDYQLGIWQRLDGGVVRMATASHRKPVHHLSARTGFHKAGEFSNFQAPPIPVLAADPGAAGFRPLDPGEVSQALDFVRSSPALPLQYGLMDLGWEWAEPGKDLLSAAVRRGGGWWWHEGRGLLLTYEDGDDDSGERWPAVSLVACPLEQLVDLLQDCRRLAAALGASRLTWIAPIHPDLQPALDASGFEPTWEDSVYVFEKRAGDRG